MEKYDVIVLGGGPGGYVAAIRAAKRGKRVVLIEQDNVGGTCLNWGCIPTKALLYSSGLYQEAKHGADCGILADSVRFDYQKLARYKDTIVGQLRNGVSALLKSAGVTVVSARGELTAPNRVRAQDRLFTASSIILATGSVPSVPPIPGAELPGVLTSDGVLTLTEVPASITIVGAGVIGMEFTTLFAQLDIPVTVLEALPNVLAGFDPDAVDAVLRSLKRLNVKISTGVHVQGFEKKHEEILASYLEKEVQKTVGSEVVLIAAGRKPNTRGIGLETAGVRMDARGFIQTDEQMRTNVAGIYAIGDITGKQQLAHVATAQGIVAADVIAGMSARMRYEAVPACIYTSPEIAVIGLTEEQARAKGLSFRIGVFPVSANGKSKIQGQMLGMAKVISDALTGEIIGAHLAGPNVTELIAGIAATKRAEATVEEFAGTIFPHPSVSEIILEALHDLDGLSVHKIER